MAKRLDMFEEDGSYLGGGPVLTVTADYTTRVGDRTILVNSTSNVVTVTLSTDCCWPGHKLTIKDKAGTSGTYPITIATEAAEDIDGDDTISLNSAFAFANIISDGANWFMV